MLYLKVGHFDGVAFPAVFVCVCPTDRCEESGSNIAREAKRAGGNPMISIERRPAAWIFAISSPIAIALCACGSGPFVAHYKLTSHLTTPTLPVVSSGVTETSVSLNDGLTKGLGTSFFMNWDAEAQVIDLSPHGKLFLLPTEFDSTRRESTAPPSAMFAEMHREVWEKLPDAEGQRRLIAVTGVAEAPLAMLPMMVRFRDINVPTTVELVDPQDLEKSLGPGFRIDSATIEITSEPVTRGVVEAVMPPWFANMLREHGKLNGNKSPLTSSRDPLSGRLNAKPFVSHPR